MQKHYNIQYRFHNHLSNFNYLAVFGFRILQRKEKKIGYEAKALLFGSVKSFCVKMHIKMYSAACGGIETLPAAEHNKCIQAMGGTTSGHALLQCTHKQAVHVDTKQYTHRRYGSHKLDRGMVSMRSMMTCQCDQRGPPHLGNLKQYDAVFDGLHHTLWGRKQVAEV